MIGFHSKIESLSGIIDEMKELGVGVVQIYTKSPKEWANTKLHLRSDFGEFVISLSDMNLYIHAQLIVGFIKRNAKENSGSLRSIRDDINFLKKFNGLKSCGIVIHLGTNDIGLCREVMMDNVISNISIIYC